MVFLEHPNRAKGKEILAMTVAERARQGLPVSPSQIAKFCGVNIITISRWKKGLVPIGQSQEVSPAINPKGGRPLGSKNKKGIKGNEEDYNSEEFLESRSRAMDEALLASCVGGNANSLRTYYQLTHKLVEKTEVKHELSGAILARLALQAEKELGGVDSRVVKVSKELPLLSQDLRLSSGPKPDEGRSVSDVASSGAPNQSA